MRSRYCLVPFIYKFYDSDLIFKRDFFIARKKIWRAKNSHAARTRNYELWRSFFRVSYLNGISLARLQQLASRINISAIWKGTREQRGLPTDRSFVNATTDRVSQTQDIWSIHRCMRSFEENFYVRKYNSYV